MLQLTFLKICSLEVPNTSHTLNPTVSKQCESNRRSSKNLMEGEND